MAEAYVQPLSEKGKEESEAWKPAQRVAETFLDSRTHSKQFELPPKVLYTQQYASIYYCRIRQLRPVLEKRVKKVLASEGKQLPVWLRTVDAEPDTEGILFGTLYKEMVHKPCVLDEYDRDALDAAHAELAQRRNLVDPEDTLALEDEQGRVALIPAPTCRVYITSEEWDSSEDSATKLPASSQYVHVADLVSGVVVAVQGKENELGEFVATRMFLPEPPEPRVPASMPTTLPVLKTNAPAIANGLRPGARYIAFISDLSLGNPNLSKPLTLDSLASVIANPSDFVPRLILARAGESTEMKVTTGLPDVTEGGASMSPHSALDLCMDYLLGLAGSPEDISSVASRIERVVIAGNSLYQPPMDVITDVVDTVRAQKQAEHERKRIIEESSRQLDLLLAQLSSAMSVSLLAGARDPSRHNWPQPPIHRCVVPRASTFSTFESLTNPTIFTSSGLTLTGTDGLNIKDICRLSTLSPLDALECTLRWRHIVPTAPDTVGCYPYDKLDPFVLQERPQIYFAGDQPTFAARRVGPPEAKSIHEQTLLLSIPSFSKTATIVLVDTETLQAIPVSFGLTVGDTSDPSGGPAGEKRSRE